MFGLLSKRLNRGESDVSIPDLDRYSSWQDPHARRSSSAQQTQSYDIDTSPEFPGQFHFSRVSVFCFSSLVLLRIRDCLS